MCKHTLCAVTALTLFVCSAHTAFAQPITANQPDPQTVPSADLLSLEALEQEKARITDLADLDAETKAVALQAINDAINNVNAAQAARNETSVLSQDVAKIPGLITQLQSDLEQPAGEVTIDQNPALTLEQIVDQNNAAEAERTASQSALKTLQSSLDGITPEIDTLNAELANDRNTLEEAQTALNASLDPNLAEVVRNATRLAQRAKVEQLQATIAKKEKRIEKLNAQRQLLPLQISKGQRRVDRATKTAQLWEARATQRRQEQAAAEAKAAEQQAQAALNYPEPIKDVFALKAELSKTFDADSNPEAPDAQIGIINNQIQEAAGNLSELKSKIAFTLNRGRIAEQSTAYGLSLRSELNSLPNKSELLGQRRTLQSRISATEYKRIDLQEMQGQYQNTTAAINSLVAASRGDNQFTEDQLKSKAREGIEGIKDNPGIVSTIESGLQSYNKLISKLNELDQVLAQTIEATDTYRSFIEERILWIRSVQGGVIPKPRDIASAGAWLLNPTAWTSGLKSHWITRSSIIGFDIAIGGIALLLLAFLPSLHKRLRDLAPKVSRFATDRYSYSVAALLLTIAIATCATMLPLAIGYWLSQASDQLLSSVGNGLLTTSGFLFVVVFVRTAVIPKGLLSSHFRWASDGLWLVQKTTTIAAITGLPLLFLSTTLAAQNTLAYTNSLGRLAFVVLCGVLVWANARIFHPHGPFVKPYVSKKSDTFIARMHKLWYTVIVGMPVMLGILATLGWYYTATKLDLRVHLTMWTVTALIVINSMLLRWLFIERRRLALERARKKREAEQSQDGQASNTVEESQLDVPEIDTQTRRVIRAGVTLGAALALFAIWADVLPALRMLDRVQLLPSIRYLESQQHSDALTRLESIVRSPNDANAQSESRDASTSQQSPQSTSESAGTTNSERNQEQLQPTSPTSLLTQSVTSTDETASIPKRFTLMDALAAAIVLIISFVLARNVPGLLEIIVLKKLPLDSGSRFAISTIVRYLIALIGVIVAFNAVGLKWSQLQFLAAAITFGLAFGLQEIFANFISGLIMLVERPVRVGDTVTVGGVSGDVTKINIRATTVRDWDRKELVIPNKTFITDQFVNWTLSDKTQRLIIPVGVAYESDVDKVRSVLLGIAREREYVMKDPAPYVVFQSFGDSTLNFELRVFLHSLDNYLEAKTDLHNSITKAFRKEKIEIAFPQQDLHIRSMVPFALEESRAPNG
ncbi:MAG: mechanosensitive ion channel [Phycisphaeraceae bacterium]|nr:mechanosensitive ion channel [Phycisphaerales bacterium]MCB9859284.1 mechanosensitive ion channel [Phycisphaeraceae bacterium]